MLKLSATGVAVAVCLAAMGCSDGPFAEADDAADQCEAEVNSRLGIDGEFHTGDPQPVEGGWEIFGTVTFDDRVWRWDCLAHGNRRDGWELSEVAIRETP